MAEEYAVGLRVSRGVGGMTDQLAGCGFLGGWVVEFVILRSARRICD